MFSAKSRKKGIGITRHIGMVLVLLVAVAALILGPAVPDTLAGGHNVKDFAETAVFFEFNSTDLDLGIQLFFDAPGWEKVKVNGPNGTTFSVKNGGSLKYIGSTEVFTESAEPGLDEANLEAAIAAFLAKFPAGEYSFEGKTIDGFKLVGEAMLTHDLPAAVELDVMGFPLVEGVPFIIEWGDENPEIVGYEVVVEMVVEDELVEERVFLNTATFPADVTSFTISEEFVELIADFQAEDELLELKVEVIAIEESGNKAITGEVLFEAD
jgi:hypothetical protein